MKPIHLEKQEECEPLDEATHAALDEAEAQLERGEVITLEQSEINLQKRIQAWRKARTKVIAAK